MLNFTFFFNNILLGVGLAMDAFSVSLANGLNEPKMKKSKIKISIEKKPCWYGDAKKSLAKYGRKAAAKGVKSKRER